MSKTYLACDTLKMEYVALCLPGQVGFQSCSPNPTKYDKKWSYRQIDFIPHVLLKTLVVEYLKWANFLSIGWSRPYTVGQIGSQKCNRFHNFIEKQLVIFWNQFTLPQCIQVHLYNDLYSNQNIRCTFWLKFTHSAKVGSMAFPKLFFCVVFLSVWNLEKKERPNNWPSIFM